jgi:NADPH2:quinone reductase
VPALTFPLPGELSFEEGAAYPHNYLTAYAGLLRRGRLKPGERVLVHGAGGGVGSAAVQLAKACGAETYALVSTDRRSWWPAARAPTRCYGQTPTGGLS